MAKVQSFMYATNVIQEVPKEPNAQGQIMQPQTHIVGPLQIIVPPFLPSTYSFFVVLLIRDFDPKAVHNIKIQFCDPKGQVLVDTGTTVPIIPDNPVADILDEFKGFSSSVGLQNVIFEDSGIYKTHVIFDGKEIGTYEVYVARKKL